MEKDNRRKIIHIIGNARIGGVAAFLLNYFGNIDREKYRFDFVTYGESEFDEKAHAIDPSSRIFYITPLDKNPIKAMRELKRIFRSDDYCAVHSHMTTLSAFALPPAARAKIPVRICHAHSTFDKNSDHYLVKKLLRPFAAAKATARMACGKKAAENLYGKTAEQAFILPNAITAERFYCTDEEHLAARKALGAEGKIVLFVGRFVYQKNLFFLLNAFSVAAKKEKMTLVLVGDGADKEALFAQAQKLGILDCVRFVPPCDPAIWYKAANVFALPSRYEGMPVVAVEAQAAGLFCIFSDAVTREADIGGNSVFLPARTESDELLWSEEFLKDAPRLSDAKSAVENAGFDIAKQAHLLTDFYERELMKRS